MNVASSTSSTSPLQGQATQTGPASSTSSIETSFMGLLVQELQNQDPTAPMDSTQMVGQMISLNQLDQLSGIHQVLTGAFGASGTTFAVGPGTATGSIQNSQQSTLPSPAVAPTSDGFAAASRPASGFK